MMVAWPALAGPNPALTPEEALLEDARSYAAEYRVTLDEAVRRLRAQDVLGDVIALVEEAARDRFAGAWVEHVPVHRVVVRLVGDQPPPADLALSLSESRVPFEFVTGAAATLDQLLASMDAATPGLRSLLPGLVGTEVDVKTGQVVLFLRASHEAELPTPAAALDAELLVGQPVRFEVTAAPVGDGHTRGGAHLSSCTSGFVVANASGTRGYITAGHCGNTQTYFEYGGVSYSTTFQSQIRDADQDVQWHTTPHDEYPHFYASSTTTYRTLTGQRNRGGQSVGNFVCHRGKTTAYSCGNIDSTTFKPTWDNACPGTTCSSVWIRVSGSSLKCYPGDSGGPWFNSSTAYGIYKGQSSSGTTAADCNWAVYMAINYASGLGVSLVFG